MYKNEHKFPYRWTKKDANFTKDKGKVMSCFCCGGGSSFGYKLAGYDVVACNEIDPKVMKMYLKNHDVKYAFNCDIRELITNINMGGHIMKEELHNLDILDASFPCSVFSIAGDRQKAWGKEKVFREGQKAQRLDDLAFYSIDLAKELKPKVVVFENVQGLLQGEAIEYVKDAMIKVGFKQIRFIEWIKTNPVPINSKTNYLTNAREVAVCGVKGKNPIFNSEYDNGVYSFPICCDKGRFHPTQKPVSLFRSIINKHSCKGDIVLDCCIGSGTTAIACIQENRNFIGFETNREFYDKANKRIENELMIKQDSLF